MIISIDKDTNILDIKIEMGINNRGVNIGQEGELVYIPIRFFETFLYQLNEFYKKEVK